MKSLYRCVDCKHYTLHEDPCALCGGQVQNPYPAKFSLVKEQRYRRLISKATQKNQTNE